MTLTNEEMLSHVDHTLLKPFAEWKDIVKLCEEAVKYKCASVCIPPAYVARDHNTFPGLNICTVIGFPLGYSCAESKVIEAKELILDSDVPYVVKRGRKGGSVVAAAICNSLLYNMPSSGGK